ncbi:MAG: preprotein translocase subunit SecE [Acidobacteria bacterium]|nr:preprotein translocase subunit SecE [Acidobacteriota bacterium]
MATTETTTSPSFPQRVTSWPARVKDYFADLQQEMRRVTWPTSKQVRATTGVVIATVFAFAAYFFVVDYFIGKGVNKLYEVLTK